MLELGNFVGPLNLTESRTHFGAWCVAVTALRLLPRAQSTGQSLSADVCTLRQDIRNRAKQAWTTFSIAGGNVHRHGCRHTFTFAEMHCEWIWVCADFAAVEQVCRLITAHSEF
jgi:hypothetical protein